MRGARRGFALDAYFDMLMLIFRYFDAAACCLRYFTAFLMFYATMPRARRCRARKRCAQREAVPLCSVRDGVRDGKDARAARCRPLMFTIFDFIRFLFDDAD